MLKKNIYIILLILIPILYFLPLFYPQPKILIYPDFGGSDVLDLNYPHRYNLSQNLKENKIPLWSNAVGMGYPIFAEGQGGYLNLTNLLVFKFLPSLIGFNFIYLFTFIFTGIGTYVYCKSKKASNEASFLGAIVFSFSGFFLGHLNHLNLIQTASYLPWIFLFADKLSQKKSLNYIFLLSFLINQQILAGFPQVAFITLFGIALYLSLQIIIMKKSKTIFLYFGLSCLLGILLSMVQILPTREFISHSDRDGGLSYENAVRYPFQYKFFANFFAPFLFGNPEKGTYPFKNADLAGIFWENTCYMGLLTWIFILWSLININKSKNNYSYLVITLLALLLIPGKYSPLYFIFTIPPFSYFRVPSRYLLLLLWALSFFSASGYDYLKNKINPFRKIIYLRFAVLLIIIFDLLFYFGHIFINTAKPANEWIGNNEFAKVIKQLPLGRIEAVNGMRSWSEKFLKDNWRDNSTYNFYQNFLLPNSNLYQGLKTSEIYPSLYVRRQIPLMLAKTFGSKNNAIQLSDEYQAVIKIQGISYLISPSPINQPQLKLQKRISLQNKNLYLYAISDSTSYLRLVGKYNIIDNLTDILKVILNPKNNLTKEIILEAKKWQVENNSVNKIEDIKSSDGNINLQTNTTKEQILVLNETFYPGWKAYINNQKTEIQPANLVEMAILVPPGKNIIKFIYEPESFYIGLTISVITAVIMVIILLASKLIKRRKTRIFLG